MSSLANKKPALFSAGSKIEIKLNNISKKFPGVQALYDVDFFLKSTDLRKPFVGKSFAKTFSATVKEGNKSAS